MRWVKWIFFAYVASVMLIIACIAASFAFIPKRDPQTMYGIYVSNIRSLDPAMISDTESDAIGGHMFECLYNYDYDARPYKLIPELADDMPQISPDGKVWTIHIKKGVRYYDPRGDVFPGHVGREVTADDFVYAWKRICNFNLSSQNFSGMFQDRIEGVNDFWEYTKTKKPNEIDWDRPIAGFKALDRYTIQIRCVDPYPQLRYWLAHLPTAPMAREAVEKYGPQINRYPIATGPYYLAEQRPEERIVFEANPVYRGGSTVREGDNLPPDQHLPHIKRVRLDYFAESLPAWAIFQQGLADVGSIPKDVFSMAIQGVDKELTPEMIKKHIELVKYPEPVVWFYGFNMLDPLVGKNKPLRQAMSLAFDRQAFVDLMLNGRGQVANGPIPPGFSTYDANLQNPFCRFDVDAAKEKLKEAEKINGGPIPPINFMLEGNDTAFRQYGEFMKKQMSQIGIEIIPEYPTWARFLEKIDSKQAQFYQLGWEADYPDEQTFLQLFYSKNAAPGPNSANYSNPEFDKLYEQSSVMNPGPERDALYKKMIAITNDDCPWLIECYSVLYIPHYDWVKNMNYDDYPHGLRAHYILDSQRRTQLMH